MGIKRKKNQKGAALIITVLFFVFVSVGVVLGAAGPLASEFKTARNIIDSKQAYLTAESGNEDAYYRLKNALQISSPETITLNGSTATVTIVDVSGGKEITSSGDKDSSIRKVKTDLTTSVTGVAFAYGAQVGTGGLNMDNNSRVEGAGGTSGNVYSNGPITGGNGATITGDVTVASSLSQDNQAQSTVCNTDKIVGKTNPQIDFAQSFSPSDTSELFKISLYIKKSGSPASITVYITEDNNGSPKSSSIASGTLDKNLVEENSYGWVDVVFSSPPVLTSGLDYWIVFDASQSSSKYWIWCSDSNNGFGNGVGKYKQDWGSGGSWTQLTGDLTFKTFFGSGVNSINNIDILGTAKANTIIDSTVGADAYYQTITNTSVAGTSYPGSPDEPILALPISDANIVAWKDEATIGGVINGPCPGTSGCSNSMGPVKIIGDLIVTNGSTLTLRGTIYVTGKITISNSGIVNCDVSYGSTSCVLLNDIDIDVNNNAVFSGSGNPDSFIMVLSDQSGCGTTAIKLSNNAEGALFYATKGKIEIDNGAQVTSVVGCTLQLSNTATITYEIGAADLDFSSGPGGGWKVDSWREVE